MKKQIIILAIASMGLTFLTNSCKKKGCTNETALNYDEDAKKDDDSCEFDTELPQVTINKPDEGMHMIDSTGILMMPIAIKVDISDNVGIESIEYNLNYVNKNDTTLMHSHIHLDGETTYSIDDAYMNTEAIYPLSMEHQDHELIIIVKDVNGNETTETREFFIHYMG